MQIKESKTNWHFYISLVKSGFRFGAGFALIFGKFPLAGALLIIAEILGIVEEFQYLKNKNYVKHTNSEMTKLSNNTGGIPIKTTSINQLILDYKLPRVDILKFNIEGNETDVFINNCEWIYKCKIIAFNNAHLQNDTQKILENFFRFKKFESKPK